MPYTPSKISKHVALTTEWQTVHALDARRALTITHLHVNNVTAGAVTVDICYVPTDGVPAASNSIAWGKSIAANADAPLMEGDIVRDVAIKARAGSNDALNLKLAGEEESSV